MGKRTLSELDRPRSRLLMELLSISSVSSRLNLDFCRLAALLARESIRGRWSSASIVELISDYCGMSEANVADRIAIGETLLNRPDSIVDRARSLTM
jgi:hypothetical protein